MTDLSDCYRAPAGDVYHIHPACPVGRLIPAEWRREGTGGLPLCSACRARAAASAGPAGQPAPSPAAESRSSPREDARR